MVLVVVLGVMNGFQENHITRRIEIGSYHISIAKKNYRPFTLTEYDEIKKNIYKTMPNVEAVVAYADKEVMLKLKSTGYEEEQILKLRAVDPDEIRKDSKFMNYLDLKFPSVHFNPNENDIFLGEQIYSRIRARINESIYLTPDISLSSYHSEGIAFKIINVFKTNSYDYDRYWGFISINGLHNLTGNTYIDDIGLKLHDFSQYKNDIKSLKKLMGIDFDYKSAYDLNRGYFMALKLEKTMIILLFIMIFAMVATNTFGAIKLTIIEKKKDISILKAIGASPQDIEFIFIIESFILGFCGSFLGLFLGTLVVYNIENIFHFFELIINLFLSFLSYLLEYMIPGIYFVPVTIYDNSIYYQSGFPVKLNFNEILSVCLAVVGMTILAAYLPVNKASRLKPNEIIKN